MPANKAADPERQRIGKQNRAEGKEFEKKLDEAFQYLRAKGIAIVDKTPEPLKPVANLGKGQFRAVYDKKAQPDYKGVKKGGRAVIYEAKYTTSDRLTKDRVTEAQTKYLTDAEALGARCYVMAGFSSGYAYQIPWQIWSNMELNFGRKYVKETDLREYLMTKNCFGVWSIK